jgi:hypothetical protein
MTPLVIRMMIVGDATTCSVILTTQESSFTIVICLKYSLLDPNYLTRAEVTESEKHSSLL